MGEPKASRQLEDYLLGEDASLEATFPLPISGELLANALACLNSLAVWRTLHEEDLDFYINGATAVLDELLHEASLYLAGVQAEEFRAKIERLGYFPALKEE